MKKNFKMFFNILFVILIVFVPLFAIAILGFCTLSYTSKGVENIKADNNILSQIGDYEQIYYQTHHENMWVFSSDASVLIAEYTSNNYIEEKQKIDDEYIFVNKNNGNTFGTVEISEHEFSIGEWSFKACYSDGWHRYSYPDDFRLIAFNDKENQIAFLDFHDSDLDVINVSMSEFIDQYFDYDFTLCTDFS